MVSLLVHMLAITVLSLYTGALFGVLCLNEQVDGIYELHFCLLKNEKGDWGKTSISFLLSFFFLSFCLNDLIFFF